MPGVRWSSRGSGVYKNSQFRDFFARLRLFEKFGGFFSRAFLTILHYDYNIRINRTSFTFNKQSGGAINNAALNFKRTLFKKGIPIPCVVIVLVAVKAYILKGKNNPKVFWKTDESGNTTQRKLKGVILTPLTDASIAREMQVFVKSDFYRDLTNWLEQSSEAKKSDERDPSWIFDFTEGSFCREVIAWMERHQMLEYEILPAVPKSSPRLVETLVRQLLLF